jgi:hypothetical protein
METFGSGDRGQSMPGTRSLAPPPRPWLAHGQGTVLCNEGLRFLKMRTVENY